jgi:hypothetical protein
LAPDGSSIGSIQISPKGWFCRAQIAISASMEPAPNRPSSLPSSRIGVLRTAEPAASFCPISNRRLGPEYGDWPALISA